MIVPLGTGGVKRSKFWQLKICGPVHVVEMTEMRLLGDWCNYNR
jgi:uncharacterized protein Usg